MKITENIDYTAPAGRLRPNWTARVGSIEGSGATRESATLNLFHNLRQATIGEYTPIIISHCGNTAMIWREPSGWRYTIQATAFAGPITSVVLCGGDRAQTEKSARAHLAQYAMNTVHDAQAASLCILDEADRAEFLRHEAFCARAEGLMAQYQVSWDEAMQIASGLRPAPAKPEAPAMASIPRDAEVATEA